MKRTTSVFSAAMLTALSAFFITCTEDKTIVNPAPAFDHIAPEIVWITPLSGSELSGDATLTFTVADSGGVARITLYRNGSSPADWQFTPHTDSLYTLTWDTRTVSDGLYILEVRAWDSSGNLGISPSLVVKVKNTPTPPPDDRTPPQILWLAPETDGSVRDTVDLIFRVVDDNNVADVILTKDGIRAFRLLIEETGEYLYRWNTLADSDGVHIWEARAMDEAGNLGISTGLVLRVQNTTPPPPPEEDRTPPDVWWESPEGGATLQDVVTLQVRVFDESSVDSVHLLKDGALVVSLSPAPRGGTEAGVEYLWDTRADSDGVHLLSAVAWDSAGNEGQSQALLVRVQNNAQPPAEDHTPPLITWLSPEPGDTVEGSVELHFRVLDDDAVDSVKVFVVGASSKTYYINSDLYDYNVLWVTSDGSDGNYIVEVRAWDQSRNIGIGELVSFQVWNHRPRVLWVPDEYETIQGAINASKDGDTVRVRVGTYYEGLHLASKRLWLESEEGPEETFIVGEGWSSGIASYGELAILVIRGFTVSGDYNGILSAERSTATIYNCIVKGDLIMRGIVMYDGNAYVYNSIADRCDWGLTAGYVTGCVFNSIFTNCNVGYSKTSLYGNWVDYGWNLFWNNQLDYREEEPQESDIFEAPQFVPAGYRLQEGSPAIDRGNPDLLDKDGSRSDIGVYGGLYSY